MKNQFNKPLASLSHGMFKQKYQSPVLRYFGLVTDLTNSAVGSCRDDSSAICAAAGSMTMQ